MNISFDKSTSSPSNIIYLIDKSSNWNSIPVAETQKKLAKAHIKNGLDLVYQTEKAIQIYFCYNKEDASDFRKRENWRILGGKLNNKLNELKVADVSLRNYSATSDNLSAFLEGFALHNYQFLKYLREKKSIANSLKNVFVSKDSLELKKLNHLKCVLEGNAIARDLVNEPLSYLTAVQLSKDISKIGRIAGFKTTVFDKKKITSLKMGGLLAVNRGSKDPPTFNILEWKPAKAKNKKPLILVGKGIVYDTGGLSLKPTPNSMDKMKSDMAGAAAVVGTLYAISKAKLPIHVIGLIPATDNRPGENAYVPGDVIKMFDGSTVEVLNTDAEGRLVLADALSYAKRYKPGLVMDFATLTGAAARAVGQFGIVFMGNTDEKTKTALKNSGHDVYERLVEFPLWEEYGELLHSSIADMKNIGGPEAGAITAGKFLEHFVDYPWLHFDIAGSAYIQQSKNYVGPNATGVGVRLLFDFFANKYPAK